MHGTDHDDGSDDGSDDSSDDGSDDSREDRVATAETEQATGCGCPQETGLSRRTLLRTATAAGALGLVATAVGEGVTTRYAFADTTTAAPAGDVLVVLSLRGGFDGLAAVVPVGDPGYAGLRPNLGLDTGSLLPLTGIFGLHPALAPLLPLWRSGRLAAVHAVGQAEPSRSHFTAMNELERAAPGTSMRTGWLDRTLGLRSPGTVFQATQVGSSRASGALAGPGPELTMTSLADLGLWGADDAQQRALWTTALERLHAGAPAPLRTAASGAVKAVRTAAAVSATKDQPANGAVYPDGSQLGRALRDLARLIRARVGLQVACVDFGDWDMHVGMGAPGDGRLRDHLDELARCLVAFATDLGPLLDDLTLVTLSEFGRRVQENGSGGTDHGHGNAVLLLGGGVVGGTVHGPWPGLADGDLVDGDLAGATDYRQLLAEVLTARCGVASVASVFPGLTPAPLGVVRARSS
jgi:uncharacterized protein (DUF1501 family)